MKPVINMRFLTMIFTILLIIAFLSMAWPFILAMLVIMAVLGIFGDVQDQEDDQNDERPVVVDGSESGFSLD